MLDYNGNINLGTAKGTSVLELVNLSQMVSNKEVPYKFGPRRERDPDIVVASNDLAREVLKWEPKRCLEESVRTTFEAYDRRIGTRSSLIPAFAAS